MSPYMAVLQIRKEAAYTDKSSVIPSQGILLRLTRLPLQVGESVTSVVDKSLQE